MRILTFTSLFPNQQDPERGVFIYQRVRSLARRGHQVTVVAPVPYAPSWLPSMNARRLARIPREELIGTLRTYHPRYPLIPRISMPLHGLSIFLATLPLVRRLHREIGFDCVDAHYVYPDGFGAQCLGKVLGIPVVVSARGTDMNLFPSFRLIRPMIRWTLSHAAAGIGVSYPLLQHMLANGLPPERATVIGNGVDLERFGPMERQVAREMLGIESAGEILLAVAALVPVKGMDKLLTAFQQLRRLRPQARLYIVGKGPLLDELQALARRLGLAESVVFAGPKRNEELKLWYNAADVACLASSREGWPNVLLESLACGTPVVATRVGSVPDVISSPELGVLVDQTVDAMAAGLNLALTRRWSREQIASYAWQRSWDKVAGEVETVLSRCRPITPLESASAYVESVTRTPQL